MTNEPTQQPEQKQQAIFEALDYPDSTPPTVAHIPYTTIEDLRYLVSLYPPQPPPFLTEERTNTDRNAEERTAEHPRNTQEQPVASVYDVAERTPERSVQTENLAVTPYDVFTQEQRTLILQAAKMGKSLREIRKHAHIGNDTQRYTLMKQWLEMNGYTLQSQQKVEASL